MKKKVLRMLLSQSLVFAFAAALPTKVLSQKDSVLTQVFEAPYLGSTEGVNVDFSTAFEFSGSAWSLEFPESDVHSVRFVVEYEDDPEKSYELRIGKGGQVYSLIGGFSESVPPQWRHPNWVQPTYGGGTSYAPWVDEVWQMVAVDESLNNTPDSSYFIHQSGVYLKTPSQQAPFYSPSLSSWYDEDEQSFTVVNWGQQAHTEDLENIQFSSRLLYYTKYTCSYPGIIQVDQIIYNFGEDNMTFINVPWGGVRHSNLGHTFLSNPDHSFEEIEGIYGATPVIQAGTTGGWLAWSNTADGSTSALAVANTVSTVTNNNVIRYGDAGNLEAAWNERDYSVLEMIRRPNNNQLKFGTGMYFRYFYVIGGSVSDIASVISNLDLEGESFDLDLLPQAEEISSIEYTFEYLGNSLIKAEEPGDAEDLTHLTLKSQPFEDSYPVFEVVGLSESSHISSDPNVFSAQPWDGQVTSWNLLGFNDKPVSSSFQEIELCDEDSFELPTGELVSPSQTDLYTSIIPSVSATADSIVFTRLVVIPVETYYVDLDQDGYGNDSSIISGCENITGYTLIGGDCDDTNPVVFPGALGTNEGVDNNCNGVIDPNEVFCLGDLNDDLDVDVGDLLQLLAWAGCINDNCGADLNNDGSTSAPDLLLFLTAFGSQCD